MCVYLCVHVCKNNIGIIVAEGVFPSFRVCFHAKALYYLKVSLADLSEADSRLPQTAYLVLRIFDGSMHTALCAWWSVSPQNR